MCYSFTVLQLTGISASGKFAVSSVVTVAIICSETGNQHIQLLFCPNALSTFTIDQIIDHSILHNKALLNQTNCLLLFLSWSSLFFSRHSQHPHPSPTGVVLTVSSLCDNYNLHLPQCGYNRDTVPSSYLPAVRVCVRVCACVRMPVCWHFSSTNFCFHHQTTCFSHFATVDNVLQFVSFRSAVNMTLTLHTQCTDN